MIPSGLTSSLRQLKLTKAGTFLYPLQHVSGSVEAHCVLEFSHSTVTDTCQNQKSITWLLGKIEALAPSKVFHWGQRCGYSPGIA